MERNSRLHRLHRRWRRPFLFLFFLFFFLFLFLFFILLFLFFFLFFLFLFIASLLLFLFEILRPRRRGAPVLPRFLRLQHLQPPRRLEIQKPPPHISAPRGRQLHPRRELIGCLNRLFTSVHPEADNCTRDVRSSAVKICLDGVRCCRLNWLLSFRGGRQLHTRDDVRLK